MTSTRLLFVSCLFMLLQPALAAADDRPIVFVSIAPQKFIVQEISGDLLAIEVLVPPGASPHTYEPKPSQMKALASAAAYFAVGVEFEEVWLKRIAGLNPQMAMVHTDAGIEKLAMAEHQHHEHDDHAHVDAPVQADSHAKDEHAGHSNDHEHDHGDKHGLDPHIWLAPSLVKQQATTVADALNALFPEHAPVFSANLAALQARIDTLDNGLRATLADRQGMEFLVFHPSWGYFAHEYGLVQIPIEVSGKAPKPAQLQHLISYARERTIRVVFAQPQFSTKSAEVIAREIDGTVILIDPLAEAWLDNMSTVAEQIKNAVQ